MIPTLRKYLILLFSFILFVSYTNVAYAKSVVTNKVVWQGYVSSNGKKKPSIRLHSGSRYYIEVSSVMYFGKWWKNRKSLRNDACYEFNAHPRPQSLPVFKNSMNRPVCDGKYRSSHIYRSAPFAGNNQVMNFWIFDTDYRDNSGSLRVKIYRVSSGGSGHTSSGGIQRGINLPGSDYRSFFQRRADPAICRNTCAAESRCKAWTYVKPGIQGKQSKCWLKHSVPRKVPSSCCSSGVKRSTGGGSTGGGTHTGGKICRNLYPSDKYYTNWISCCDTGNGKSRWKRRSNGKTTIYNRSCKSWGIDRYPPRGGGSTATQTNTFCKNYANTANQQQRKNVARGCGFTGRRWQNNYNNHYNWCKGTSRSSANSETNARSKQLSQCAKRGGGSTTTHTNNFCKNYANTANQQQRKNTSRGCGFTGRRWQNNYNNHYNWCKGTSRNSANSETNARTRQLSQCRKSGSTGGKVCRNLRKGDPYYSGWVSCCDVGNGKSRWKKRSTGKSSNYGGTCKSWGIR